MIFHYTYKHLIISMGLVMLSTFCILTSYKFSLSFQEEKEYLSSHNESVLKDLNLFSKAEKTYQMKENLWSQIKQKGIFKRVSRTDLEATIKLLSHIYKFSRVELNFLGTSENCDNSPLISQTLAIKIYSPYDTNIYQFLNHLRNKVPGIFIFKNLSFDRLMKGSIPHIRAEITMKWLHFEKCDE